MKFAKYEGTGNDFIMVLDADDERRFTGEQVRALCDRRYGVGADGVIRVAPATDGAHVFMDYANADGSVSDMCGNGIRCVAVFARAEGLVAGDSVKVATRAGTKFVRIDGADVTVDIGAPVFEPDRIPVKWRGDDALSCEVRAGDSTYPAACLSMGNPHAVVFVDDPARFPVAGRGPEIERSDMFPERVNVEFVAVETPRRVRMRVWERGSRETLSCGSGACAAFVAARLLRGVEEEGVVSLPGGDLRIRWDGSLKTRRPVLMTGPASEVYRGEIDLARLRAR
ncbi:MAG TPA: diaminopimelate epimerase [Actinomycetota bacterium]|jgi:diaminopimelate epimerase|nr:diaminopimelate epimerase [Actinomycetota bacterium]